MAWGEYRSFERWSVPPDTLKPKIPRTPGRRWKPATLDFTDGPHACFSARGNTTVTRPALPRRRENNITLTCHKGKRGGTPSPSPPVRKITPTGPSASIFELFSLSKFIQNRIPRSAILVTSTQWKNCCSGILFSFQRAGGSTGLNCTE